MKISKRLTEYAKHVGFKLPLKAKPLEPPRRAFDDDKVNFDGITLIQTLQKNAVIADEEIKESGYQSYGWGGGDSGLEINDMRKMNKIFQFKGMGYAEYEWNGLGKSWKFLKENINKLVFSSVEVYGKTFYTICLEYHNDLMEKALMALVANNQFPVRVSKTELCLHKVVQGEDDNFVGGWHFNSHYLFFADKDCYEKFRKLLQIEASCNGTENTALIVVDVQNDFCPGGSLAVTDGDKVIPIINNLIENKNINYIAATKDSHPSNHSSFLSNNPLGVWKDHCVQDTFGSEFNKNLNVKNLTKVFNKGTNPDVDSYSGFFDNDRKSSTGLDAWLRELGVNRVVVVGLALDYGVKATAQDAHRLGLYTIVYLPGTKAVNIKPSDGSDAIRELENQGIIVARTIEELNNLLNMNQRASA